ncbi:MAG TPA: D-alanyl-D-alanine carboxypeptidase family protein [Nitrosomonas sp.]|nr:D-alanyl-D-alanine carboxypeptidase family protein [Nitrosomonas sp.]HMW21337.1 D-alanyl-D-alanine carboxypeptidase family protein [Nitrosomonas sp.]HMW68881.1 D-alanyl-D-alanine carboxypeptidase family protein [Nitrosomonas sp.]HMY60692.1 D-alanyl-D-alanine carboxypeptidase family protein [Nitrosomonas sp.]HMY90551.1 D-alanyl-D-alanine carboxypeptidase family protein [Nitrosomonas sp.]
MFSLKHSGKKGLLVITLASLFMLFTEVQANPRYAAIVIDATTGTVLHEENADEARYIASLTKMMTLYLLFESIEQKRMNLDTDMRVSAFAASMPPTNIRLQAGNTLSVRDAIKALIVRSANDVAVVVAEALAGSEARFSQLMTNKARQLGMYATTFRNASGLPNKEQVTSARDMSILSTRLMKDFPQHYHFFSTQSFRHRGITYNSHNRLLRQFDGADGLKTGFIRASGFHLATSAKRDNHRLVAVVMGGETASARDQRVAELLNRNFDRLANPGSTPAISSAKVLPITEHHRIKTTIPAQKSAALNNQTNESAVKQLSKPQRVTYSPTPRPNKIWGIQLGSYSAHDRAHAHAKAATRWAPGEVAVTMVKISNRKLYRAQLVGLQENQARSACQNLSRQGIDCMVVRAHG